MKNSHISSVLIVLFISFSAFGQTTTPEERAKIRAQINYEMRLTQKSLTDLPDSIYAQTQLEELNLSINNFTTLSDRILEFKQLKKLDMNINALGEIPLSITKLSWLESLSLEGCEIKKIRPEIGNMKSLKFLSFGSTFMGDNPIDSIPPEIGKLTNMEELYFYNCDVKAIPWEIGNLRKLKTLRLAGAELDSLPTSFNNLDSLRLLDLGGVSIDKRPDLSGLRSLEKLWLYNYKNELFPTGIGSLKNLREFSFDFVHLDEFKALYPNLSGLEEITIYDTRDLEEKKKDKIQRQFPNLKINFW